MAIVDKIVSKLYEDNDAYYSFRQIIDLGTKKPLPISIDHKRGEKMRWNQDEASPFDYGDIPGHLNPADDMDWDIIIVPSSKATDKNLLVVGVLRVSEEAENIPYPNGNKKGNHKLILGNDGVITQADKDAIESYFKGNNVFMKPDFFDSRPPAYVIQEDWEKSTMKKMKLGN